MGIVFICVVCTQRSGQTCMSRCHTRLAYFRSLRVTCVRSDDLRRRLARRIHDHVLLRYDVERPLETNMCQRF